MTIEPDPEYDFVPRINLTGAAQAPLPKRGRQCGECGMKFEYGANYGFYCGNWNCPCGFGPTAGGPCIIGGR